MKKWCLVIMVFVLVFGITTNAFSEAGCGKGKGRHGGWEQKVFKKAICMLKSKEELNLTDEQIQKIKDTKIKMKKDLIRIQADIDTVAVDIKAMLWEDDVNLEEVNKLIDHKYGLKASKAKLVVQTCQSLDNVLTDKQKETLETLKKQCPLGKKAKDKQ